MSTRLERLLHMDALIRNGSYPSAKAFVERFEVSERTVLNDVRFFKDRFHAPLEYSRSRGGYFYTDLTWKLPTFPVTEGQLLAFFLSVELAHRYLGTSFETPLRDAIRHLIDVLPDSVQVSIDELASHYTVRVGAAAKTSPETLLALQEAIHNHNPVDILYFTAGRGEETQRIVYPYHLLNMHGEWHLIAYDLLRQGIRQFALPRIRTWHVLAKEHFEVDPAFSVEGYFGKSFQAEHGDNTVEVVLLFDGYQARYIRERTWHPSQQIEEQPDGSLIMHFTTGAISEVQRWVMGYGSHVKVLAPTNLAESIISEFQAGLKLYE
ncbi:MAG: helix-turn-helix transcriptional regulator [Ktedonobacteraceae bacterium]